MSSVTNSYVESQLITGEHIVYKCKIHWQIWVRPIVTTVLALVCLALFSIMLRNFIALICFLLIVGYVWADAYVNFTGTELAVTNKRVICKFGFIRRHSYEINLDKIEGVSLNQGICGRIFGCSSVAINGTGSSTAPVPFIADSAQFKKCLVSECEKYKTQNGHL